MFSTTLRSTLALAERRYLRIVAVLVPVVLLVIAGTIGIALAGWIIGATLSEAQYGHAAFAMLVAAQLVAIPAMCRIAAGDGMRTALGASVRELPTSALLSAPFVVALAGSYVLEGPVTAVAAMVATAVLFAPTVFAHAARAEDEGDARETFGHVIEHWRAVLLLVLPGSMLLQALVVPVVALVLGPIAAFVLVQPLLACLAVAAARSVAPARPQDRVSSLDVDRAAVARQGLVLPDTGDWVEVRAPGTLWVTLSWGAERPQLVVADAAHGWITVPQPAASGSAHELTLAPGWYFVGARAADESTTASAVGITIHRRASDKAA